MTKCIYSRFASLVQHLKLIIIIYHINKQQRKNDIIIPVDIEKNGENLEHTFMKKNHQGRSRGELPQLDKDHLQNIYSNLMVRHWIIFP